MFKDPIVEEVRNAGIKIFEELEYDKDKIAQYFKEGQARLEAEGWKFVSKVEKDDSDKITI